MMLDRWEINSLGACRVCQDQLLKETGLVQHGFSTRPGGKSRGRFSGLNLALHVGDEPETVIFNRRIFSDSLQVNLEHWVTLRQIHSHRVFVVGKADLGKGSRSQAGAVGDGDAMITAERGIPLVTFSADCLSLLILDPVQKAIGLAHAGWKGTSAQIGKKTLQVMTSRFGTDPGHCLVAIGPGIGKCCYEIDKPVYRQLLHDGADWRGAMVPGKEEGKWLLDLKLANWRQLLDCGVKEERISVSASCTKCNQDLFYSYRGAKGQTGRMAALLMLI